MSAAALSPRLHAIAARTGGGPDFRNVAIEDFVLDDGEAPFDVVVAIRVGSLDGRHDVGPALARITAVTRPGSQVFIERGGVLAELDLGHGRSVMRGSSSGSGSR